MDNWQTNEENGKRQNTNKDRNKHIYIKIDQKKHNVTIQYNRYEHFQKIILHGEQHREEFDGKKRMKKLNKQKIISKAFSRTHNINNNFYNEKMNNATEKERNEQKFISKETNKRSLQKSTQASDKTEKFVEHSQNKIKQSFQWLHSCPRIKIKQTHYSVSLKFKGKKEFIKFKKSSTYQKITHKFE